MTEIKRQFKLKNNTNLTLIISDNFQICSLNKPRVDKKSLYSTLLWQISRECNSDPNEIEITFSVYDKNVNIIAFNKEHLSYLHKQFNQANLQIKNIVTIEEAVFLYLENKFSLSNKNTIFIYKSNNQYFLLALKGTDILLNLMLKDTSNEAISIIIFRAIRLLEVNQANEIKIFINDIDKDKLSSIEKTINQKVHTYGLEVKNESIPLYGVLNAKPKLAYSRYKKHKFFNYTNLYKMIFLITIGAVGISLVYLFLGYYLSVKSDKLDKDLEKNNTQIENKNANKYKIDISKDNLLSAQAINNIFKTLSLNYYSQAWLTNVVATFDKDQNQLKLKLEGKALNSYGIYNFVKTLVKYPIFKEINMSSIKVYQHKMVPEDEIILDSEVQETDGTLYFVLSETINVN